MLYTCDDNDDDDDDDDDGGDADGTLNYYSSVGIHQ